MPVQKLPFDIPTPAGDRIVGDLYIEAKGSACPIVIMIHGYTGFKDWGSLPTTCTWFAERGFAAVAFNYSHNGIDGDPTRITDAVRFSRNTVSRELDELTLLVRATVAGMLPGSSQCDRSGVFLLGHSRGGAEAIIVGAESADVRAVASWGAIARFDRWSDCQKVAWRTDGVRRVTSSSTDLSLEIDIAYLLDIESHRDRFDLSHAVAAIGKPLLLVHGLQDVTVPPGEARELFAAANAERTELVLVPAAGHTFGARHPFSGMTAALETALSTTLRFFQRVSAGS